jgi:hypothetical protein
MISELSSYQSNQELRRAHLSKDSQYTNSPKILRNQTSQSSIKHQAENYVKRDPYFKGKKLKYDNIPKGKIRQSAD